MALYEIRLTMPDADGQAWDRHEIVDVGADSYADAVALAKLVTTLVGPEDEVDDVIAVVDRSWKDGNPIPADERPDVLT